MSAAAAIPLLVFVAVLLTVSHLLASFVRGSRIGTR